MHILLTGAFGNIGLSTLPALLEHGHKVRCFDLPSRANRRLAGQYKNAVELFWGDLRDAACLQQAVHGQDIVVHLAFVIPTLSATGVSCEDEPDWARAINVGGTQNLIQAMEAQSQMPRMIFASSLHVYGRTQELQPPRTVDDPVQPVEHYAHHKVACEDRIRESGLTWTILRLGAAFPVRLILDPGMFDVPLENRIEFVHRRDVATAIVHAVTSQVVWGHTWLIGGGPSCQVVYREVVERGLKSMGVGMIPEAAFSKTPYSTDWLDTRASEKVLQFQQRTLDDYVQELSAVLGFRRTLVRLFQPLVRAWFLSQSPYYRSARTQSGS